MFTETPKISLTINLEGSHKSRFVRNKETGKFERYYGKVYKEQFIPLEAGSHVAKKRVILNEEFVLHSIRTPILGFKFPKWFSLPIKDRINKHVRELAKDMCGKSYIDHKDYQWDFVPEQQN